jgi:hypothetical protein
MGRSTQLPGFFILLSLICAGARAESVGNVGAVNQSAHGAPPGQPARQLSLGANIENRERIETNADGSAQILFRDTSTMTIGRNSTVTVDRFVYSGDSGAGSQGLSLAKGVMRFVGGGVSHEGGTQVRVPAASIGVRGGSALFDTDSPCGGELIVLLYGVVEITSSIGSVTLTRPGYGVCLCANGLLSEPIPVPSGWIAPIEARLSSTPGQTGGASRPPQNSEAGLRLGQSRPPTDIAQLGAPDWLDNLSMIWTGNALVQSHSAVLNLPAPPLPR